VPIWHLGALRFRYSADELASMEPAAAAAIISSRKLQEAAMSHHWRSHVGRADVIQGAGDHDVEYFAGWVISAALTLATVLVLWHFRI
jgi:hypothetical protein